MHSNYPEKTSKCQYLRISHASHILLMYLQLEVVEEVLGIKPEELWNRLVCVATDGASVNVGAQNGICARLRDEWAPFLDNVHCYAHIVQVRDCLHTCS